MVEKSQDLEGMRAAAKAHAKVMLPLLQARRRELATELVLINREIETQQAILGPVSSEPLIPPRVRTIVPIQEPQRVRLRAERGQVFKHVDEVLATGKKFGFSELQKELHIRFGIKYGFTSVYRALKQGQKQKRYENVNRTWGMKK
jgi:hypothetical protein